MWRRAIFAAALGIGAGIVMAVVLVADDARADDVAPTSASPSSSSPSRPEPPYTHLFATAFVGDGLRFNNPYRLSTQLTSSAEGVSRTAAYVDLGGALAFGDPAGLQHGGALRASIALEGVRQAVFAPGYFAYYRARSLAAYARLALAIVTSPETTFGGELGVGGIWFVRAGIGAAAEIVGDLIYGTGTREVAHPAYPIASAQLGIVVSYEALP